MNHISKTIKNFTKKERWLKILAGLALPLLACSMSGDGGTAIPPGRPASFEVQTPTPELDQKRATLRSSVVEIEAAEIAPLGDAPTHTPDPNARPTALPQPSDTPIPPTVEQIEATEESLTSEPEPTEEPTEAVAVAPPPPPPPAELDPPRSGGDWDFESEFIPWPNPYGEPCPGASVASGWSAFVEQGEYGSSCLNENLYQPNVFSGIKSQEITFDFIAANSGVYRTIPTKVGHRYNIIAYAKHDFSIAPVQMFLGVDLTGGTAWDAETVEWFPWDDGAEDVWKATEETVTATGGSMTIFIRGLHPMADQGGKTVIDNVSVTDLGP